MAFHRFQLEDRSRSSRTISAAFGRSAGQPNPALINTAQPLTMKTRRFTFSAVHVALVLGLSLVSPLRAEPTDAELQKMKATMDEMAKTIQVLQKRVVELENKEAGKK